MKKDSVPRVSGTRVALAAVLVSLVLCTVTAQALAGAGSQTSGNVETRTIVPGCQQLTCDLADWNGSHEVDVWDIYDFVADFAAGDPRTDLNCDGTIDSDDYFAFLDLHASC